MSDFGKQYFELLEFDGNEVLLLEIRKHIFGLILIYLVGAFVALAILITTVVLASGGFLEDIGFGSASAFVVFLGFVFSVGIGVVTYINGYLYKHNVIFVTSEKIAQVVNITIFHRKVSQLSIGDAQDVTVSQKTFFARAFNYGTLVIETAGEQQNYTFDYVPNPYPASKIIVGSHEQDKQKHGN